MPLFEKIKIEKPEIDRNDQGLAFVKSAMLAFLFSVASMFTGRRDYEGSTAGRWVVPVLICAISAGAIIFRKSIKTSLLKATKTMKVVLAIFWALGIIFSLIIPFLPGASYSIQEEIGGPILILLIFVTYRSLISGDKFE